MDTLSGILPTASFHLTHKLLLPIALRHEVLKRDVFGTLPALDLHCGASNGNHLKGNITLTVVRFERR